MNKNFVHLHCHSHYSLLNGTATPDALVRRAKELGMSALALTDYCNLYGIPEFCNAAKQHGIKPIIGIELAVAGVAEENSENSYGITLLAMNREGWQNLVRLQPFPVSGELLRKHSAGLICLSGFAGGEVGRLLTDDCNDDKAKAAAQWYRETFGNRYYLELRNHGIESQTALFDQTAAIGSELGIPTVATNDIHYLDQADGKVHDILLCIKNSTTISNENRPRMDSEQHYFRNTEEMLAAFSNHYEAVNRTIEIAERIEPDIFSMFYAKKHHPVVSRTAGALLRELCLAGMTRRYADSPLADEAKRRLDSELTVIEELGYANYFLFIGDVVRFAQEQGIYHAARGSAAGSLVCYVLGISHDCPIEHGLYFERFIATNPTVPDIDIDVDAKQRDKILDYVAEKYGKDCIAKIATFGTFGATRAIKDVGRTLEFSLKESEWLTELIPMHYLRFNIDDALKESAELRKRYTDEPEIRNWLDLARQLEGLVGSTGIHPCAFAIADVPLAEYMPLQTCREDIVTQWGGCDIENVGVLKQDFLGVRTFTLLKNIVDNIKAAKGETIDPYKIALDDRQTFDTISRGDTVGVFQLEGGGIRELLQRLKPDNFRDIVAVLALYRPAPLKGGLIDHYIAAKHGGEMPKYVHPAMEEVLSETYGMMIYQEQVMQILHRLGNIPLCEAYDCIKAIGKNRDFSRFREQFVKGFQEQYQKRETGEEIFDTIFRFAPYAFLKAHAVAYARLTYMTAYLKTHYPEEFALAESLAEPQP